MPDPRFAKPWHGIPREEIDWNPTINIDACIGCGTCVTGCGRLVYRFDFTKKKAVVGDPLNCLVGCTTCANTCPAHAISFPPLDYVANLLARPEVHHHVEDELLARQEQLNWRDNIPDEQRIKHLLVEKIDKINNKNMIVTLKPKSEVDCTCQFTPGQYMELWVPGTQWMSRAYSIGNAPKPDGSIELHLRRVEGGRFTTWAFEGMKLGDELSAMGPMGDFYLRSAADTPLLFVARGTGFAPIKAMIEQQVQTLVNRDMILFWGVTDTSDFYQLDILTNWTKHDKKLKIVLTARVNSNNFKSPKGIQFHLGTVYNTLEKSDFDIRNRDVYLAGPVKTVRAVLDVLTEKQVPKEHIYVDSFGG
ncbi:MAG: oxidoreductase [Nitrospiraceae bacterium]|nr:oxidoreductase [Nitrospiraceae bacterium]